MELRTDIAEITLADLKSLVANRIGESRTLDYKQTLPGLSSSDKKEFLKDVSALANTDGGHLIYGIVESDDGSAESFMPLIGISLDDEERRLSQILGGGLSPRIPFFRFRWFSHEAGPVLVLYVGKSFAKPHQITLDKNGRFYLRSTRENQLMDVNQIRQAVLDTASMQDRIGSFVRRRLAVMSTNEDGNIRMEKLPRWVVHMIPLSTFSALPDLEPRFVNESARLVIPPINSAHGLPHLETSIRFEGLARLARGRDSLPKAYSLVMRNGVCEGACNGPCFESSTQRSVVGEALVHQTIDYVMGCFELYQALDVSLPYLVVGSLLNCKSFTFLESGQWVWPDGDEPIIDRNELTFPTIEILDIPESRMACAEALRPIFEAVFNAGGLVNCPFFDGTGAFVEA